MKSSTAIEYTHINLLSKLFGKTNTWRYTREKGYLKYRGHHEYWCSCETNGVVF